MKIIAIGGGEIGRPGYPVETTKIDKEIIHLTGKESPRLLFIPTASSDSESYYEVVKKHFGKRLGCKIDVLYLINKFVTNVIKEKPSKKEIETKILNSDIVYVGGGDADIMLEIWERLGVDKILKVAAKRNIVLSGVSAGSYCWFEKSLSSSEEKIHPGLGLIRKLSNVCHYPKEDEKKKLIWKNFRKVRLPTIALEDCSAVEIVDNKYRILTSSKSAKAFKLTLVDGKETEESLPLDKRFKTLNELMK
jgi:dipeptidase E